jgi:hypothetical protein
MGPISFFLQSSPYRLSQTTALQTWDCVCGERDVHVMKLLKAARYIQLAITLLVHLAETHSPAEDPHLLWHSKQLVQ